MEKSFESKTSAIIAVIVLCLTTAVATCSADLRSVDAAVGPSRVESQYSSDISSGSDKPFLLSGRSWGILLAMGGAALITRSVEDDSRIGAAVDGSHLDAFVDAGDFFGNGLTAGVGAAGLFTAGRLMGNQRLSAAGGDLGESLLLTWGSVWTLKVLVDSDRPGGGDHAFPSGHTATAFAMAPVLTNHFGWRVGVPAYALATATALARLEERKHCVADVLVGAAIGLVIGSEVTSKSGFRVIRDHIAVHGRGLGLKINF